MRYILLQFLIPIYCFASVDIAFVEVRTHDGQLVQLEENGRFAHVAISYKGKWLHSRPYYGVELITEEKLRKIGELTIVTNTNKNELEESELHKFLGKPYDNHFSWGDESYYCSELVAKILEIEPRPMKYNSSVWSNKYKKSRGQLGISPDDLFNKITSHSQYYYSLEKNGHLDIQKIFQPSKCHEMINVFIRKE
nr:YiiX/YebB-like N1pC/P60 family cysteine hydrolase [Bacteriovorax sp. HI3]